MGEKVTRSELFWIGSSRWVQHFQESPFLNGLRLQLAKTGASARFRVGDKHAQSCPACTHSLLFYIQLFFPTAGPVIWVFLPDAWLWTHRISSYTETIPRKLLLLVVPGFSDFPRSPACLLAPVLQEDELVSFLLSLPPSVFFFSYSHNCVRSNSSDQVLIPQQAQCFCLPV